MKLIITEKNTIEGFTAGWVAKRILVNEEVKWAQIEVGKNFPEVKDMDVICFGVSFPRVMIKRIQQQARSLMIYDNTMEAKMEIGGLRCVKVELNKTPARIAWNVLKGNMLITIGKQNIFLNYAPWIVDYSEDKALWKWPNVKRYFVRLAITEKYEAKLPDWDRLAAMDVMIVESEGLDIAKKKTEDKKNIRETGSDPARAGDDKTIINQEPKTKEKEDANPKEDRDQKSTNTENSNEEQPAKSKSEQPGVSKVPKTNSRKTKRPRK